MFNRPNIPALTAELVEAFGGMFLSPNLDGVKPTPEFHRETWARYVSTSTFEATAAPRSHAKSTAFTQIFGLASLCFRQSDFAVVASATEALAIAHVGDMAHALRSNDNLRAAFYIESLETDSKTMIVVKCKDGHRFCIKAIGFGQKVRGMTWNNRRPNLLLLDDLEDDETMESAEQLVKAQEWFLRKLLPIRAAKARVRMHGTILGRDSILAKILRSNSWGSKIYKAHHSTSDFSDILWPEMFSEATLRQIKQMYVDAGDLLGYSQEYLNTPIDDTTSFIRKADLLPMTEEDHAEPKVNYCGCDFAVATKRKNDQTSFTVGGRSLDGTLHIHDQHADRLLSTEWIQLLFDINDLHRPEMFFVEGGVIWQALEPVIQAEERKKGVYLPFKVINPTKSKAIRGQAFQKMTRAKAIHFDKQATWWDDYETEIVSFVPGAEGADDDQFDSTAILCRGITLLGELEADDLESEDDLEDRETAWYMRRVANRISAAQTNMTTGY